MNIVVDIKDQYGVQVIHPVCAKAYLFAHIAGTKTLTRATVERIKALGYSITVVKKEVVL